MKIAPKNREIYSNLFLPHLYITRNLARYAGLVLGPAGGWGPSGPKGGPLAPRSGLRPLPSIVVIVIIVIVVIIITTMEHTHRTDSRDTHTKFVTQ